VEENMRARRALLYVPGDNDRKIQKATTLVVDTICLDMEDGVANNRKNEARQTITKVLNSLAFGRSERLARINPVGSGLENEDLQTVLPAHPDGIVVPKVERPEQVQWVSNQITEFEQRSGWPIGKIPLLIGIETAFSIINLRQIASADPRLEGLIFGSEDLASDIGAIRTQAAWEVFYARSAVVTHAAAFGLQAIDMVNINLHDLENLRREAEQGAQLGFAGKQIIHPDQIAPVQEAFTPDQQAIENAIRLVEAFQIHQAEGTGAFAFEGKMIDMPIVKAAERLLMRARAAGKI
jgi:citrate lyase beta subunit